VQRRNYQVRPQPGEKYICGLYKQANKRVNLPYMAASYIVTFVRMLISVYFVVNCWSPAHVYPEKNF